MIDTIGRRWQKALEGVADAVNRRPTWALGAFSVVYFACAGWLAAIKPMWNDEFFTYYLALPDSLNELRTALLTGADQHPPTFYLLSRVAFPLLGQNQLALRIPELCGYWLMSVCLFAIVSRRTDRVYGFIAMLIPLVTATYPYAYEARAYALMAGFTASALLSWQVASEGRRRALGLIGLAASSMLLVSSHYYGLFAIAAVAIGEVTRSSNRRRVDPLVWIAFASAAIPLLALLPFLRSASGWAHGFWARAAWSDVPQFYGFLFQPAGAVALLLLLGVALGASMRRSSSALQADGAAESAIPGFEIAAAWAVAALPVIAVVGAKIATGAFTPRYALPAVVGAAALLGFTADRVFRRNAAVAGGLVLVLILGFAVRQLSEVRAARATASYLARTSGWLQVAGPPRLPIVAWHSDAFLRLGYYAPPALASRLVYLADAECRFASWGTTRGSEGCWPCGSGFGETSENTMTSSAPMHSSSPMELPEILPARDATGIGSSRN